MAEDRRLTALKEKTLAQLDTTEVLVDLWELDLRPLGGDRRFFCAIVNEKGEDVVWQGRKYLRFPISADGFEVTGQGSPKRPRLNVPNIEGFVTEAVEDFDQLVGAIVIRRQVPSQFLDAENFKNGNPNADTLQEIRTKYVVEQMTSLNSSAASFELSAPSESTGATFPCRIMLADTCGWDYRGDGCGYKGRPVADENNYATNDPAKDKCSKNKLGCQARFGATAVLPIGAWISLDKLKS
jgi:phage minor tail protein L|nr:MAG TPA: minor tail protein L [Caudoviricetes sp.]